MQSERDFGRVAEALADYHILGTPAEDHFDLFTMLCRSIFDARASYLGFVCGESLWFKSTQGIRRREVDLPNSPHGRTISGTMGDVVEIGDLRLRREFARMQLNAPQFRFYCGTPIVTPAGVTIGALAVLDDRPRQSSSAEIRSLLEVARGVTYALEARKRLWQSLQHSVYEAFVFDTATWSLHWASPEWPLTHERSLVPTIDEIFSDIDRETWMRLRQLAVGGVYETVAFHGRMGDTRFDCLARRATGRQHDAYIVIECRRIGHSADRVPLSPLGFSELFGTIGERFEPSVEREASIETVLSIVEAGRRLLSNDDAPSDEDR